METKPLFQTECELLKYNPVQDVQVLILPHSTTLSYSFCLKPFSRDLQGISFGWLSSLSVTPCLTVLQGSMWESNGKNLCGDTVR